jgi:hypothetical protein
MKQFFSGLFLCIYLSSLAQSQPDSTKITYDSLINKVAFNQTGYKTLSVRTKLTWDDGNSEQDFQGNFRMLKDSLVWISMTGSVGVEGARILITPDTFRIMNKMQNEYAVRDFNFVGSWLLFPVNFKMLQQIVAAEKIDIQEKVSTAVYQDSMFIIYSENDKLLEKVWVNTGNYTIAKLLLRDKLLKQEMTLTFEDYKDLNGKPFSYMRTIDVDRDGVKLKLTMNVVKARMNENLSYPFEVGEKYKRVE